MSNDSESLIPKRIAIYGGSFDPPTDAHLTLIDVVANKSMFFHEVWVIPCGKRDDKPSLTDGQIRV